MINNDSKYLFVSYRDWAKKSHDELHINIPHVTTNIDLLKHIYDNSKLKFIFFVGWSELINEDILKKYNCFCIHPSMLPLYRGGSPIQNQIIDGVVDSGVTLFKMTNKIDAGPIFLQKYLSLNGTLDEIFNRISLITSDLINEFIIKVDNNETIVLIEQDDKMASTYKRRSQKQSEITIREIENFTALQLYNKIRALNDPYPNAFITCSDGKKLFLVSSKIE